MVWDDRVSDKEFGDQRDMGTQQGNPGSIYRIKVRGTLNPELSDWLGDITILSMDHGETLLEGKFPDQPALRGFVEQLWNLNFTVLSIEIVIA